MAATRWIMRDPVSAVTGAADAASDGSDAKSRPMMIAPNVMMVLQIFSPWQGRSARAAHRFGEIAVISSGGVQLSKANESMCLGNKTAVVINLVYDSEMSRTA